MTPININQSVFCHLVKNNSLQKFTEKNLSEIHIGDCYVIIFSFSQSIIPSVFVAVFSCFHKAVCP